MKALYYSAPRQLSIQDVAIPQVGDEDVLVKVEYCGICGTDAHIHDGEFIAKFPLIPGHEISGTIVQVGKDVHVEGIEVGKRCVGDNATTCGTCFFCRRGRDLLCENFASKGVTMAGGFAEYVSFHFSKIFPLKSLSSLSATLIEPAACALHGLDRLHPFLSPGSSVLLMGAGPTGLILAQLLKLNGAAHITLAANKGPKMDLAKKLAVADVYLELDRAEPGPQWKRLAEENAYGFDVVIEATGVPSLAENALSYVRRGGTLMIYGVYANEARVSWSPEKIFANEINIIGSFAQVNCFPRAVAYLDSGKVNVEGMVTDIFTIDEYEKALEKMGSRTAVKIAIKPM